MKRGVEKRDAGGDRTYARRGSRLAPETEMAESGSFAANVREREVRKRGENRTDDTLVPPHEYGGRFGSPQLPNRSVRVGRGVEKVRETRRGRNSFRLRREEKAGHRSERVKGDVKSGRGWRRGSAIYPLT